MEATMKVGVLGSGDVAKVLASGFLKHGHQVKMGSRTTGKLADWAAQNSGGSVGSFGDAATDVLALAGTKNLAGKTVMDACNPIEDAPPDKGVLRFFTDINKSLMEGLQSEFKEANFVKAFNSVGAPRMVNPQFAGGKPTMFICGNSDSAKKQVAGICDQFGWETADMGTAEAARAIEPLCMLWCIPGFVRNEWTHAFKLLVK
jgi:predicted dinucleotide-binding enzyme